MDVSAVVLHKLLAEKNVEVWSKIKLAFLDPVYSSLFAAIGRHYEHYGEIPAFSELEVSLREGPATRALEAVKLADYEDVSIDVAIDALIDRYTQDQTIQELDKFLDKLPILDSQEVKTSLSEIVQRLDEKTLTTEGVYSMADMVVFKPKQDILRDRVYLGLNNQFDAELGGVARQELILVGGMRGSGKSITCSNIQVNQYKADFCSIYFTIEMIANETLQRNMAILSGVSHSNLKKGELDHDEILRLVQARADMFADADDLVDFYKETLDPYKFEARLVKEKRLRDSQMIIVDDRALTLASIDLHVSKYKAKFGDKLAVVVVDYLNQIVLDSKDQYDWKVQVEISKGLKNIARKHDVVVYSPYQIDQSGEARFAKGILDAADIGLIMKPFDKADNAIGLSTTKIRGDKELSVVSGMNWDCLRIDPTNIATPAPKEEPAKKSKKKNDNEEPNRDTPW
jgi:replicative DNA helicase